MTNQVTGWGVGPGSHLQSSTNLQNLTPAEAELVLGGRREVVLRYRLHILSSETTESTGNDVPLLLEEARGRSLYDAPHRGEKRNGLTECLRSRGSALEEGRGRGVAGGEGNGGRWKRKQEKEERCSLCESVRTRGRRVFILRVFIMEKSRDSPERLDMKFSERTIIKSR